jgi:hypothetical protein
MYYTLSWKQCCNVRPFLVQKIKTGHRPTVSKQSADIYHYWLSYPHRSCSKCQHHPTEPRTRNKWVLFTHFNPYKKCVQYLAYSHVDGIFIQHVLIGFAVITEEKVGILAYGIPKDFEIARFSLLKYRMEKSFLQVLVSLMGERDLC